MSFINKRVQFRYRVRANGRNPVNFPHDGAGVPLRITQYIPMKLKDVDDAKLDLSKKDKDIVCVPEMMRLFDCYEKHDFSAQLCNDQFQVLEKCFSRHKTSIQQNKSQKSNKAFG